MEDYHHTSSEDEIQPVGEQEPPEIPVAVLDELGVSYRIFKKLLLLLLKRSHAILGVLTYVELGTKAVIYSVQSIQAVEVAKTTANSINDLKQEAEDLERSKEGYLDASDDEGESEDEDDKQRNASLEKLENATDDTFLGQASYRYI
ncbi:hypothetical protein L6452_00949 [Arctium lappa]|uniref:Uncharacterized protein n=1 Tax=Arctium lappa TaxID=4217 RepID=A0ACB9FG58_ARCLA|nr:hypothetical protein L6452_00949 [Arctium lappa]